MTDEKPAERSIARTAALLLPLQIVFRGGEAALPVLLAAWFGRSEATDVYFLFAVYFMFAGSLVSGGFQDSVLVPIITEVRLRDPRGVQAVVSSLLGHLLLAASALALVLGGGALAWARFRIPASLFHTSIALAALFSVHLIAVGVRSLVVALLNANGRFSAHPVASGSGFALAIAIIAIARHSLGVVSVPLGMLAGELLAIAVLAPFAKMAIDVKMVPSLARPEPVRRFFRLVSSDVAGATITRINPVIDQLVAASTAIIGGGTILRYAMEVGSIPTTLLQATVLPVLLSRLSTDAASASVRKFDATVKKTLLITGVLLAAIAALLVVFRRPLMRIVFLHGEMDALAVADMASVLPWTVIGAIPFGALLVLARAHVALQNTRIMLGLGVLNAASNVVLDLVLVRFAGLEGIAFATTLVHLLVAVAFWILLRRRLSVWSKEGRNAA